MAEVNLFESVGRRRAPGIQDEPFGTAQNPRPGSLKYMQNRGFIGPNFAPWPDTLIKDTVGSLASRTGTSDSSIDADLLPFSGTTTSTRSIADIFRRSPTSVALSTIGTGTAETIGAFGFLGGSLAAGALIPGGSLFGLVASILNAAGGTNIPDAGITGGRSIGSNIVFDTTNPGGPSIVGHDQLGFITGIEPGVTLNIGRSPLTFNPAGANEQSDGEIGLNRSFVGEIQIGQDRFEVDAGFRDVGGRGNIQLTGTNMATGETKPITGQEYRDAVTEGRFNRGFTDIFDSGFNAQSTLQELGFGLGLDTEGVTEVILDEEGRPVGLGGDFPGAARYGNLAAFIAAMKGGFKTSPISTTGPDDDDGALGGWSGGGPGGTSTSEMGGLGDPFGPDLQGFGYGDIGGEDWGEDSSMEGNL
jgi:hypothetical protein